MIAFGLILGVTFFCSPSEGGAHYDIASHSAIFAPAYCREWKHAPRDSGFGSLSVFVAAHEIGHSRDPLITERTDCSQRGACESFADCYAVGHMLHVAKALHYTRVQAIGFKREARTFAGRGSYGPIAASCWRETNPYPRPPPKGGVPW